MVSTTTRKPIKSVKLTKKQISDLKKRVAKYKTWLDVAIGLKVSKHTLNRVILTGVCHEKTYNILFPEESEDLQGLEQLK